MKVKTPFKEKFSNFLYYNWKTIVVIILLAFVFVIAVRSCVQKTAYDINILIATDGYEIEVENPETGEKMKEHVIGTFTEDEEADFEKILSNYAKDYDGNGSVTVNLTVVDLSDWLIETSYTLSTTMLAKFNAEISVGETMIFIMSKSLADKYLYEIDTKIFTKIGDITGDENDLRMFIPITDTVFYTECNETGRFKDDMAVLFRIADYSDNGSKFAKDAKDMFSKIYIEK